MSTGPQKVAVAAGDSSGNVLETSVLRASTIVMRSSLLVGLAAFMGAATALLEATESASAITLTNERVNASITKPGGRIVGLTLDGVDVIGPKSGNTGCMYLDCYCTEPGFWTPGTTAPAFELFTGTDSTGAKYGGASMSDGYASTGLVLTQYFFLREGETGIHMFSRVAYHNETAPINPKGLQELRTLFRPNTALWTHLLTNEKNWAPLPSKEAFAKQVLVQDATWYLGNTPEDAYVQQYADWWTKYSFQDTWRDIKAFGVFADGTQSADNSTFGAWSVLNTRDTYFGGPLHSDLTVDGIVYDYMSSNHHGNSIPNITDGFDRTFGPRYFHLNRGPPGTDILTLHQDATKYADPTWDSAFYDSLAPHVPGYVPSSQRGTFKLQVVLPLDAKRPVAVLSQNGIDFQDNVFDTKAYQYWVDIDKLGHATIPMVKAGTYRLTIYADDIFGQYVKDDIKVTSGKTQLTIAVWLEENAGLELFRVGTPDKSSGEFRHGYAPDATKPRKPEEYRIYWGRYDYLVDFPNGIRFRVGEDDPATALNYVHWSVFGGNKGVNNWTLEFDVKPLELLLRKRATFTVQLAGAKTAAGNNDVFDPADPQANLNYTINVNGVDQNPWIIPYWQSSSCALRSAVTCYNVAHKFEFASSLLKAGVNAIVLSLPYGASALSVQYDALRLEVK